MSHAERIRVIIQELEVSLETGDMVDAIELSIDSLNQILAEMDDADELSGA